VISWTGLSGQEHDGDKLSPEVAGGLAQLALGCIEREFPNKPDHVLNDSSELWSPKDMHPAFYGCFDWHSSVHGHWMLVRLLKTVPSLPHQQEIRNALNRNLSGANILAEVEYLGQANRKSFERTYGWAWLLKLAEELENWDDPDGRRWSENIHPLADAIAQRYIDFLPKQNYPIRTGVHPNTAFGLAFAYDYATSRIAGSKNPGLRRKLQEVVEERARYYYNGDRAAPAGWEPGGEDFFSPVLMEADLMRRILPEADFQRWFHDFLPGLESGAGENLLAPAVVIDRTDPKLVHLDGLNLSRAWCLKGIVSALPDNDPAVNVLSESARVHALAGLSQVASGNYEGEHWLASFAVYLLTAGRD
jgi:hypothetical protein